MRCSSHFRDLYSTTSSTAVVLKHVWDQRVAGSVPGTLQVGVGGKLHTARSDKRLRPDLCSVTSFRGASWRLSRTEGICRQKTRDGGTGRPAESALGNQPFMSRRLALSFRGSHLFATEAARQILAVLLHLLLLCDSRPPTCFPPRIAIHFICQTHKRGQAHNGGTFEHRRSPALVFWHRASRGMTPPTHPRKALLSLIAQQQGRY